MESRTNSEDDTKKEVVERHDYPYPEDREYKKEEGVAWMSMHVSLRVKRKMKVVY